MYNLKFEASELDYSQPSYAPRDPAYTPYKPPPPMQHYSPPPVPAPHRGMSAYHLHTQHSQQLPRPLVSFTQSLAHPASAYARPMPAAPRQAYPSLATNGVVSATPTPHLPLQPSVPEQEYRGPKPTIPKLVHPDPSEFARLRLALGNLLPFNATDLFKCQILVDNVKLNEAKLIADAYLNSPTPYSDTTAALHDKFGQPHQHGGP